MSHLRQQVRDAVAARVTGLATTGARVYANNVDPLAITELPAITLRNGPESIERKSVTGPNPFHSRSMTIYVTANARATSTVPDVLDTICAEVEVALMATIDGLTLGGVSKDLTLLAIDEPRLSGEGDRIVGSVDMQFEVLVYAREGIPDVAI